MITYDPPYYGYDLVMVMLIFGNAKQDINMQDQIDGE